MAVQTIIKLRRDTAANWTSTDPTLAAGEIGIETDSGSLKIGDGATEWTGLEYGPVGHELVVRVKNASNTTAIPAGTFVQFAGAAGDTVTVEPAVTDGSVPHEYMVGVVAREIAAEGFGDVVQYGVVAGLNTSDYIVGDILYPDPDNAGQLTDVKPTAPDLKMPIAAVIKVGAGTSGRILVRMDTGLTVDELHDVNISSIASGEILKYNGTVWTNGTLSLDNLSTVNAPTPSDRQLLVYDNGTSQWVNGWANETLTFAVSDEATDITTGTAKVTFRAPFAMTLTAIPRASLSTASSSGDVTVDINEDGTSVLGANKLSIDASEKTSVTATTPTTLADTAIADDAEITVDIDGAGTGAKGLKVTLYYRRA